MPLACLKQAFRIVELDRPGKFSRSKQSRSNVPPKYASARRFFARLASEIFLTSLQTVFFNNLLDLAWSDRNWSGVAHPVLQGKGLKGLEDRIDALMCAYMTYYFWYWRERRCEVIGDLMTGYIIGPRNR